MLIRLLTCSEERDHVQTYSSTKGFSFWDEICKGTRYYIKFKTLYQCHNIVSISSHCRPINFESLYQLRVIVSVSSHCINFESLYQSFIKSKLTLYFFLDFLFISKHRSETSYSIQESAYTSVFPCHWKEAKKKSFHILDLKNGLDIVYLLHTCKSKKKMKTYSFLHIVYIVYVRVKSPWMQKQNKRANECSAASEWAQRSARAKRPVHTKQMSDWCERTSERTSEWPSTLCVDFVSFQVRAHRYETFFVSMVEEILFFTICI